MGSDSFDKKLLGTVRSLCWSGAYVSDAYIKDRALLRCCRPPALSHQSVQSGSPDVTMVQPTQSGL